MKKWVCLFAAVVLCIAASACAKQAEPIPDSEPGANQEEAPYTERMYPNTIYNEAMDVVVSLDMTKENVEQRLGEGEAVESETEEAELFFFQYEAVTIGYNIDGLTQYIFVADSDAWVVKHGVGIGSSVSALAEKFAYAPEIDGDTAAFYFNASHMLTQPDSARYTMLFDVEDGMLASIKLSYLAQE